MKHLLLATAMVVVCSYAIAQAVPVSTMIEKTNRNAVMININQPVKVSIAALQEKLMKAGLNERVRRGAASYKGITLSEISSEKIDLYTKVENAPNNSSTVYMAVSKGYNNFTNNTDDSLLTEKVIAFLNSFVQDADNHFTDLDITQQLNEIEKSEKAYRQLEDKQADLEKKRAAIDEQINNVANELLTQRAAIDKKKLAVDDSKAKRRE